MPISKYERRSAEAQTVMNKAPHAFITWGNLIVLGVIVLFLGIASRISIPRTSTIAAQIEPHTSESNKLILHLDARPPEEANLLQPVNVFIEPEKNSKRGSLQGVVDSLWFTGNGSWIRINICKAGSGVA